MCIHLSYLIHFSGQGRNPYNDFVGFLENLRHHNFVLRLSDHYHIMIVSTHYVHHTRCKEPTTLQNNNVKCNKNQNKEIWFMFFSHPKILVNFVYIVLIRSVHSAFIIQVNLSCQVQVMGGIPGPQEGLKMQGECVKAALIKLFKQFVFSKTLFW